MKNTIKTLSKKKKIVAIIVGLVVILAGWWAYSNFAPHPLGDKLEYVGKSDYGCYVFCDVYPGSTYYYATDMSVEEVGKYFKKAQYQPTPQDGGGGSADYNFQHVYLLMEKGTEVIVNYYDNKDAVTKDFHLQTSTKKYLIEINAKDYNTAEASL